MISEGWAAFFPVYPGIGKPVDFNLALAGAEAAWDGKLGAWAQEGERLLLGYEFRLSVRLGKALDANEGLDAFSRLRAKTSKSSRRIIRLNRQGCHPVNIRSISRLISQNLAKTYSVMSTVVEQVCYPHLSDTAKAVV